MSRLRIQAHSIRLFQNATIAQQFRFRQLLRLCNCAHEPERVRPKIQRADKTNKIRNRHLPHTHNKINFAVAAAYSSPSPSSSAAAADEEEPADCFDFFVAFGVPPPRAATAESISFAWDFKASHCSTLRASPFLPENAAETNRRRRATAKTWIRLSVCRLIVFSDVDLRPSTVNARERGNLFTSSLPCQEGTPKLA